MALVKKFLTPFGPLSQRTALGLAVLSFVLPLALWCAVSYLPFLWHPLVRVEDPGSIRMFQKGGLVDKNLFATENAKAVSEGRQVASGALSNPIFLPAPHEVVAGLYRSFTTPPRRTGDKWLH